MSKRPAKKAKRKKMKPEGGWCTVDAKGERTSSLQGARRLAMACKGPTERVVYAVLSEPVRTPTRKATA